MKIVNIIVILLFSFACKNANGRNIIVKKTIPVGKNRELKTIQSGVSMANDGDTVLVDPGLYKEGGIIIEKSIVLKTKLIFSGHKNACLIFKITSKNVVSLQEFH